MSRIGYKEIIEQLLEAFRSGAYALHAPLPPEGEMAGALGVSRGTLRQALSELEAGGYIRRRQGARAILISTQPDQTFRRDSFSAEQFINFGESSRVRLLSAEPVEPSEDLARLLAFPANAPLTRLQSLRLQHEGGPTICYSETYILREFAGIAPLLETEGAVFALIEKHHGEVIRKIRRQITAVRLDLNIANRLGLPEGLAALRMVTRFHGMGDRLLEVSIAHFPEGVHTLDQEFRRTS